MCGACSRGTETVAYLLIECQQWQREQEVFYKALDDLGVERLPRQEVALEAQLLADPRAAKPLLKLIGQVQACEIDQQAAEAARRSDW
ncbi:hypothetical protein AJ80_06652 [Polytolypa hystricis UAMH7299]|uniref:Uncharacterized protein n=1 Tax=Polytolypa hystricis (strain UAMH7299) TaxID=1447883 RepID=A0A2B7XLG8_POLH7|nr:hypothetical protein AJ80_06652 [Polytolypa hystricis UAMH7299]